MTQPYETLNGLPSEGITFSRLLEHIAHAREDCITLGHLKMHNNDKVIGQGFLAIAENLQNMRILVTQLATRAAKIN